jgi:hypothetical protein
VKHRCYEKIPASPGIVLSLLTAYAFAACATPGEGQPEVNVAPPPDSVKPESVSVFGIFRNGRMSPEAWEDFGKALSAPFSAGICQASYDVVFTNANPGLADAIDEYTKENGVSDELLEKFAPLAKGDTILLIALDGQLPKPASASAEKAAQSAQNPSPSGQGNSGGSGAGLGGGQGGGPGGGRGMGRGGGGMGRGGMGGRRSQSAPAPHAKSDKGSWELTAYFYSVRLRQSTRQVNLTQQGQDIDGDLKLFAAKLGTEMPGVPCHGWESAAKVDADTIRKLAEREVGPLPRPMPILRKGYSSSRRLKRTLMGGVQVGTGLPSFSPGENAQACTARLAASVRPLPSP